VQGETGSPGPGHVTTEPRTSYPSLTDGYPSTSEVDLARARADDPGETDRIIAAVLRRSEPADHPGDLLAAELLAAFPGATEVVLDDDGWTTVAEGPYGTLAIRDLPPDRGIPDHALEALGW
jgi:hypothetical protein